MAEPTTPRFSLLSFHFPAFFPFSPLSSRIFVNFSNRGWLQAFAELRDPKCNHSILGHRYRFLASFSPSLSVLLFRGNTHGITSFPTRALHSQLRTRESYWLSAAARVATQPLLVSSFFLSTLLLCLSPVHDFSGCSGSPPPPFLNFHGLFTASCNKTSKLFRSGGSTSISMHVPS